MAKKRQRPASSSGTSKEADNDVGGDQYEFAWRKVEVGIRAPSRASATKFSSNDDNDDNFDSGNNHYDEPTSSIYRSAGRDLEANPAEGFGMFLGLEVLDGSRYSVVEEGGYKRLVPKLADDDKKKKSKEPKSKKKQMEKSSDEKKESEVKESEQATSEPADEAEASRPKKKKRKNKKKKAKKKKDEKARKTATESEGEASKEDEATTKPSQDQEVSESKSEGEPELKSDEPQSSDKNDTVNTDDMQDPESNPQLELFQNSWMTATGGVALHNELCLSLLKQDWWSPTPIQAAALPAAILGRRNIVGAAPTGSGKTMAYLLPIFEHLLQQEEPSYQDRKVQALILAPTRELALQVQGECDKLVKGKCAMLVGGLANQKQERILRTKRPPIIIATPGRLWEMISSREAKVVMLSDDVLAMMQKQKDGEVPEPLDEDEDDEEDDADVDANDAEDELFEEEVPNTARRPVYRQTFVYSATLTLPPSATYIPSKNKKKRMFNLKGVQGAIEEILDKARARGQTKVIDLSNSKKQAKFNEKILQAKETSKKETKHNKREEQIAPKRTFNLPPGLKLLELKCTQMHKDSHLYAYLVTTREGAAGPCLVFCNSIKGVRRVGTTLKLLGLPVRVLHANMQQRARFKAVESLQKGERAVVVATDIAARGLDIPNVTSIVHYDVARKVDGFVHRAGRTARGMGENAVGSSLSLIAPADEKAHRKIVGELNATIHRVPLDSRLLTAAQARTNLASKIVAAESIEGKAQQTNDWFMKNAEEAGLEVDADVLEGGLLGGNLKEQQQFLEAGRAKTELRRLLAEPMVTQRFGKFMSVNSAAKTQQVTPFVVKPTTTQGTRSKKRRRKGNK
ncbi:dependent RNA helicase [Seminavis robusta]|uniref:ATP-dependent RNA helicase n=1 Tax=Seminavis robusta TaxID=568900 RepID=A0A9N8EYC6_9STRA|nr:dependent RNA helicase [Seminavis robusta]|eukprot:Sro1969_g308510.1 dependent RNA helicase (856) ;mRNA; r:14972-18549